MEVNPNYIQKIREAPNYCALKEILAAIIRGPEAYAVAGSILQEWGEQLEQISGADLDAVPGIGPVRASSLIAAMELHRRISRMEYSENPTISSPKAAAGLVQYEMQAYEQEHLMVILLDARNRLIRVVDLYKGSLTTSLIRSGEIFREAIKRNAAGIILAHNHPSGDPSQSPEDLAVTRNAIEAGRILDIPVLDHIIIGRGRFVSLREQGIGFGEDQKIGKNPLANCQDDTSNTKREPSFSGTSTREENVEKKQRKIRSIRITRKELKEACERAVSLYRSEHNWLCSIAEIALIPKVNRWIQRTTKPAAQFIRVGEKKIPAELDSRTRMNGGLIFTASPDAR